MDQELEKLYQGVKTNWEEYGNDPEDFDWECFIKEIKDHKDHSRYDYWKDLFHYKLHMHIQWYRVTTKMNSTDEEIASNITMKKEANYMYLLLKIIEPDLLKLDHQLMKKNVQ